MNKFLVKINLFFVILLLFSTNVFALNIDNWAMASYNNLLSKKIIPNIMKRNENYKENITRIEFTHLIITYLLSNKTYNLNINESPFKDIDDNYVNLANSLNIINGYTDKTFKPYMNITRSEAAVIIYNTEKLINNVPNGDIKIFKDYKFIPKWAEKSIGSVSKMNVINGYPDKTFLPSKNITRQESIVMINSLILSKKSLIDAFNISKNDEYMSKMQYEFVLKNIPISKYNMDTVKEKIFETSKYKREEIYKLFLKVNPYSINEILTSPSLIFKDDRRIYIIGIEKNKKEQRVFMLYGYVENSKLNIDSAREYSPWFTTTQ